jgi:Cu(I)/Ag(I) efflux system membrane fusion protein
MNIKKLLTNRYVTGILLLLAGFFIGRLVFHRSPESQKPETLVTAEKSTIWTCSMHPQIRMNAPGQCPLCGMDLIPLNQDAAQVDPNTISMTEDAARIAGVQTTIVAAQKAVKEVRLYGKIGFDERLLQSQAAHLAGRIEQLLINFTGETVQKGQTIAQIYSPLLVTAQQELLEALQMKDTAIISAARDKLRQWKFSDAQITAIEISRQVKSIFDVTASVSGVVTARKVNKGDYVQQGMVLYEIADLSRVWALFDAYESDLAWIRKGEKIAFTLQSMPGKEFSGVISFIDPVISAENRVARLRVEVLNPGGILKPGMFATGSVNTRLTGETGGLVVPHSAVLWTGTRSILYVKIPDTSQPTFLMREITLGPDLGDSYLVLEGLEEGEEIVTNGTFNIDASAQLMGKPSMMNAKDQ